MLAWCLLVAGMVEILHFAWQNVVPLPPVAQNSGQQVTRKI
jgi:hypothetical protein